MGGSPPLGRRTLYGRDEDLRRARERLLRLDVPLLTVTGVGGCGKTALAITLADQVADDFADGVVFVALDGLQGGDEVRGLVLSSLGLAGSGEPLVDALRGRHLLLVLDTFDPVMDASGIISELITECPDLKVVVTSREPLRLNHEWTFGLPPLPVPDLSRQPSGLSLEHLSVALARQPAVALLVDGFRAAEPAFRLGPENVEMLVAICRHVDGLPLGLELAAGRPAEAVAQVLAKGGADWLDLPVRDGAGGPARHRSLRASFDWSFERLKAAERLALRRLAIFEGAFSLAAAEMSMAVGASGLVDTNAFEAIAGLVAKSWLSSHPADDGEPRWGMLSIVRAYALGHLRTSGEEPLLEPVRLAWLEQLAAERESSASGLAISASQAAQPEAPEAVDDPPPDEDFAKLSPKEREVAVLLAQGKTNRQIADTLVVTLKTVEKHASNVLRKLGLENRQQVAVWMRIRGLAGD